MFSTQLWEWLCGIQYRVKAPMHEKLWQIVCRLNTDYEPFGKAEREGPDCSGGCRHYIKLTGEVGNDWGVCSNAEIATGRVADV